MVTLKMLKESSWRIDDPTKAKLFVVPFPIGIIATSIEQQYYSVAFDVLVNHTLFKSTYGHNHVIVASFHACHCMALYPGTMFFSSNVEFYVPGIQRQRHISNSPHKKMEANFEKSKLDQFDMLLTSYDDRIKTQSMLLLSIII